MTDIVDRLRARQDPLDDEAAAYILEQRRKAKEHAKSIAGERAKVKRMKGEACRP